jgi:hypothetical protein
VHINDSGLPLVLIAKVVIAPVEAWEKRTSVGVNVLLQEEGGAPPVGHPLAVAAARSNGTLPSIRGTSPLDSSRHDGLFEQVTSEAATDSSTNTFRIVALLLMDDVDPLPAPKQIALPPPSSEVCAKAQASESPGVGSLSKMVLRHMAWRNLLCWIWNFRRNGLKDWTR